jgi:hypothetical protein
MYMMVWSMLTIRFGGPCNILSSNTLFYYRTWICNHVHSNLLTICWLHVAITWEPSSYNVYIIIYFNFKSPWILWRMSQIMHFIIPFMIEWTIKINKGCPTIFIFCNVITSSFKVRDRCSCRSLANSSSNFFNWFVGM